MKKILLSIAILGCFSVSVFSQLSTRENEAGNFKLGTRPTSGDMALTFQGDLFTGSVASLYNSQFLSPGDLLTFKVFGDNDLAYRIAFRLYNENDKFSGDDFEIDTIGAAAYPLEQKVSSSQYLFAPGIEKHFLKSNIFDVYIGAEALLGLGSDKEYYYEEFQNGDYIEFDSKTSNFVAGLGALVGVNVFVGQLPVSVGIEYGLGLLYNTAGKTSVTETDRIDGVTETYSYYTYGGDLPAGMGERFESLKSSEFGMDTNQNVRIVLNIYFGR